MNRSDSAPVSLRRAERRDVRYPTLADAVRDAARLAEADAAGAVRASGNWTLGQALTHLAWWADEPFTGYRFPLHLRVLFRVLGPLTKRRVFRGDVAAGVRLPGVSGGTYGAEDRGTTDGLAAMRSAFERLDRECPPRPDVGFGRLSHEEWRTLHRRHAEHHLSFFHVAVAADAAVERGPSGPSVADDEDDRPPSSA
jgi:hypothetical protein